MATTAARASPPARRTTVSSPPPTSARGAARTTTSPRVSSSLAPAAARRTSLKAAPPEVRDALSASLKQETDQKEQLLVQVQNKDETIGTLSTENANLTSALHAAETRINELYADQSRSELDLAQRIEISENLRAQVRELEKEKRDVQRRYNEQTSTFEAERQAFYDNEQHLKSRIMSLTQARKQPERPHVDASPTAEAESIVDVEVEEKPPQEAESSKQDMDDPETEPAEMTSLRLELSTLSTSYASLQSTLVLLQTQLVDLKRVNHELQEENESYMILLREKTLSGQFNVMEQVGAGSSDGETEDDDEDDELASADVGSLRSAGRSILDKVEEEEDGQEAETLEQQLERSLASPRETDSPSSGRPGRSGRKRTGSQSHSPSVRGETLADLPITGPGLDLAAELGRAENKDILDGNVVDDQDRSVLNGKKRSKKSSSGRKDFDAPGGMEPSGSMSDIEALRTEVKSLKDANKALSLYASKIIDRIISQEGFEHVLAVDYEKEPQTPKTPSTATPVTKTLPPPAKPRPQSVIVARSTSTPGTPSINTSASILPTSPKIGSPPNPKVQRRSLSFDWKAFSIFSGEKKPAENPNLRPLTLKPGAGSVTGNARKLETHEDENDRRERERMNATMKLMGIQPQPSPVFPPSVPPSAPAPASVPATPSRRFSFFSRAPAAPTPAESSDTSSVHSNSSGRIGLGIGLGAPGLTQEALEHAEAENSLAALDAHERTLSAEIAKGSTGGFTEIAPRKARARRSQTGSRSGSANGSTVWSAGEDDDE
ncbi:hypothetical protein MSAN_02151400 [Mycena sanguinolenta]|uniref:Uncharacterized protein n=1 Tax=Mycena sanguinolenta TaxID=230812 RepID=A0A8H6XDK3_9AGAR|nr:hypothetical protein MSAN_02151400 [Mycena sanguinolenta]